LGRALAVFDLDGTVTRHDTLGPYLWGWLWRHPWRLLRVIAASYAPLLYLLRPDRGTLKGTAIRAVLGGLTRERIAHWSEQFVRELIPRGLYSEALVAIEMHRSRGDRLLLMSASTDLYVPLIGEALRFDEVICTKVRWSPDGRLDGRLAGANCQGEEKHRCLSALLAREKPDRIYAYGNSRSDLAHMVLAHEAFLVNGPSQPNTLHGAQLQMLRWHHVP
jgi:phosphatidylglycerophosphatase C